jgi:phospholipid/cholesterol/gamma-HCH transport system ATP-binding protein
MSEAQTMGNSCILFQNAYFNYDGSDKYLLDDITLSIGYGEMVFVTGNSGGGKSTLLRLAAGLITPLKGEVVINGVNTAKAGKPALMSLHERSAFIFQDSGLLNNMTMFDNLALPLRYHSNLKDPEINERVQAVLKEMELEEDSAHFPNEMSRGERKLGSIGRAMITCPEILYYDEPLEGLDFRTMERVKDILFKQKEERKTVIIIEQDMDFALKNADKIAILHTGKLVFFGTPAELEASGQPFVRDLM